MKTQCINTTEVLAANESAAALDAVGGIQLADYELVEKIGAGGYGEVWRAVGPGGLPKAVKVLYGERTGSHAEAELKALERMRDLRHPFLLSIERIEVVNSRLIVVTELADGNLSERFEEHVNDGRTGIPRDELVGYLQDSADALDFMAEQHGLQHLDIKPDNILLQGSHAKIGDFGLAKDLNAKNVSLINGFTPMFAAPELFQGQPGHGSDQYSLAIVYQLMLTGSSPFNGRTAAQLTAQHLKSQPDLSSLHTVDRPVVARALSKNVNSRFDSCRQFVDELARRKPSRSSNRVSVSSDARVGRVSTSLAKTAGTTINTGESQQASTPVKYELTPATGQQRRSIVIGVGGLAGEVLLRVKQFTTTESPDAAPAFLQIDTDSSALTSLCRTEDAPGMNPDETLKIALRTSKQYRAATDMDLSWMSRRWLFNIPRSGQVDGIRPLGRLALFDHREAVERQLKAILADVHEARSDGQSIDIYTVASVFGGTGSGAVSDIGLMLRRIIRQTGVDDIRIYGVLMHGTGTTRNVCDVQEANAVSTLTELRHLMTPGLDTPRGFEDSQVMRQTTPFDGAYFMHLGDGLNDLNLEEKVSNVARFLTDSTTSDAQADFHAWRSADEDSPDSSAQLRVLGIGSQDAVSLQTASDESGNLSSMLLRRWCQDASAAANRGRKELPPELTDTQTLLTDLKLTADTCRQQVMAVLRGESGRRTEAFAREIIARLEAAHDISNISCGDVRDFMSHQVSTDKKTLSGIISEVHTMLADAAVSSKLTLTRHLSSILDTPQRLQGTQTATEYVLSILHENLVSCQTQLADTEGLFRDLIGQYNPADPFPAADGESVKQAVMAFCRQYCVLLSYQAVYQCFTGHVKTIVEGVAEYYRQLKELKKDLQLMAAELVTPTFREGTLPTAVVEAFDRQVRLELPTLLSRSAFDSDRDTVIRKQLSATATGFLMAAADSGRNIPGADDRCSDTFPKNAWPGIRNVSGKRRVLGMVPNDLSASVWKDTLRDEFGDCVAVRPCDGSAISVVCEIEGVPIGSVLNRLTGNNPHISDVASRIHTRIDVDW